ncbi:tyrosine-protein phosphatase [Yinghuangia seranimata]|uniref:tyrosine-protein phosphatase n=1 Tax=Yinghuangia seranimata TaxID=408067 RepID=UPI00248BC70F|nr:tyrosine-protein phosphatase [Yinghuangia seranimata]MDI2127507.1 tyrosine-protein phosphatase [Yinghuangia seranimata]
MHEIAWLELPDQLNARDVGGLPVAGGGTTRSGVLMRCETPDLLTDEGVARLSGVYGVRHVFDLRSQGEGLPVVPWDGVTRHRMPLLGRRAGAAQDAEARGVGDISAGEVDVLGDDTDLDLADVDVRGAGRLYLGMAERGKDAFVQALRLLTADGAAPTLVHCTAGKDRTGVLVALLLAVVDTHRQAIVDDYAATRIHLREMFRRIDRIPAQPRLKPGTPAAAALRDAAPESMEAFLDAVAERYGGASEFFVKAGARPEWIERWRERFVADVA